jgi:hypothetical protein
MNTMMKINLVKIATVLAAASIVVGLGAPLITAGIMGFFGGFWLDY